MYPYPCCIQSSARRRLRAPSRWAKPVAATRGIVAHRGARRSRPHAVATTAQPQPSSAAARAPASAVGRPRVRVCPLRLAAASGGCRTSPGCRLLPLPTPGAALWLKPPLLCFTRGTRRGPLLCLAAPAQLLSGNQARPSALLVAPALLRSGNQARPSALLCFLLEQSSCSALLSLGAEESSVAKTPRQTPRSA